LRWAGSQWTKNRDVGNLGCSDDEKFIPARQFLSDLSLICASWWRFLFRTVKRPLQFRGQQDQFVHVSEDASNRQRLGLVAGNFAVGKAGFIIAKFSKSNIGLQP